MEPLRPIVDRLAESLRDLLRLADAPDVGDDDPMVRPQAARQILETAALRLALYDTAPDRTPAQDVEADAAGRIFAAVENPARWTLATLHDVAAVLAERGLVIRPGHPMERLDGERCELRAVLMRLRAAGFDLALTYVEDGEETTWTPNIPAVLDAVTAVDESRIILHSPEGRTAALYIVLGNSPAEVVADLGAMNGTALEELEPLVWPEVQP